MEPAAFDVGEPGAEPGAQPVERFTLPGTPARLDQRGLDGDRPRGREEARGFLRAAERAGKPDEPVERGRRAESCELSARSRAQGNVLVALQPAFIVPIGRAVADQREQGHGEGSEAEPVNYRFGEARPKRAALQEPQGCGGPDQEGSSRSTSGRFSSNSTCRPCAEDSMICAGRAGPICALVISKRSPIRLMNWFGWRRRAPPSETSSVSVSTWWSGNFGVSGGTTIRAGSTISCLVKRRLSDP